MTTYKAQWLYDKYEGEDALGCFGFLFGHMIFAPALFGWILMMILSLFWHVSFLQSFAITWVLLFILGAERARREAKKASQPE